MVQSIYPTGLRPWLWPVFDRPSQYSVDALRELAAHLDIEQAEQKNRTQLLHQIVAWKIEYKEKETA